MEKTQIIAERIKKIAKDRGIPVNKALSDCGIGPNTVTKLGHGTDILTTTFCKIADYFDCSADYLLGRDYAAEILADEQQLLHDYRELDDNQKNAVRNHASDLAKLAHFEDAEAEKKDGAL